MSNIITSHQNYHFRIESAGCMMRGGSFKGRFGVPFGWRPFCSNVNGVKSLEESDFCHPLALT